MNIKSEADYRRTKKEKKKRTCRGHYSWLWVKCNSQWMPASGDGNL